MKLFTAEEGKRPELVAARSKIYKLRGELLRAKRELDALRGKRPKARRSRARATDGLGAYREMRDECDKLFARLVKFERGQCQSCGLVSRKALQWAHGFSRRYRSVRWDWRNAFALCAGCHKKYTHDPVGWDAFMRKALGDHYEPLRALSQIKTRFDPLLVIALRNYAERVGVLTDEGWKLWQEGT